MNPEVTATLTQFGTAGLMGWMWLTERRASAVRERQLTEAHDRLMSERAHFELVVAAIKENTKVLATLEAGQRSLASVLDRMSHDSRATPAQCGTLSATLEG